MNERINKGATGFVCSLDGAGCGQKTGPQLLCHIINSPRPIFQYAGNKLRKSAHPAGIGLESQEFFRPKRNIQRALGSRLIQFSAKQHNGFFCRGVT